MAGATLTNDFWANDILWQLSVFAYNLPASWRVRQKKNKFRHQEHSTFIDWFVAVPAKITKSGHQMELKLYSLSKESGNIIFTKLTGRSLPDYFIQADLTGSSKRHKNKKGGKYEYQPRSKWERYIPLAQKRKIRGHFMPKDKG